MKKKNLKSLKLVKKKIADLKPDLLLKGGTDSAKWPCVEMDTYDIHCPSEAITACVTGCGCS